MVTIMVSRSVSLWGAGSVKSPKSLPQAVRAVSVTAPAGVVFRSFFVPAFYGMIASDPNPPKSGFIPRFAVMGVIRPSENMVS